MLPKSLHALVLAALALGGVATSALAADPAAAAATAAAPVLPAAPVVRELHRKVVLPETYEADPARRWPLWIHLHGNWPRKEGDLSIPEREDVYHAVVAAQAPVIFVGPLCPPNQGWDNAELLKLLDSVLAEYRVDPDRVYLSGGSMGGYGAYALAKAQPERFAALITLCAGSEIKGAGRLRGIPIWAFHGLRDPYVSFAETQRLLQDIVNAGGSVRFTMYGDVGHEVGERAIAEPDFVSWMLAQKKVWR